MAKEFKHVRTDIWKTKQYITKNICIEIKSEKIRKV